MSHSQYTGRPKTTGVIKEEDERFIRDNYLEISVTDMAKKLYIPARTIYRFLDNNGLKSFDRTRVKKTAKPKKREFAEGCFDWKDFDTVTI